MAKLNGKWRFVSQTNLEGFHTAKKSPQAYKDYLKGLGAMVKADPNALVEQLTIDVAAGTANRTTFIRGEKKRDLTVKIGQEQNITLADGRTAKGKAVINSDTKATITEKGDDYETTVIFELRGSELVVTQKCGDQEAVMKYFKV